MRRFSLLIGVALLLFNATAARALKVVEVTSPKGVKAYFAEDHASQVISFSFSFDGGTAADPVDKQGLSHLGASLFNEGAGDLDAFAFQSAMADRAISIYMSADRDHIGGTVVTTTPNLAEAVRLARLALLRPRHDQEAIERMRREVLVGIAAKAEQPGTLAERKLFAELFGGHPYAREEDGVADHVKAMTRADVQTWAKTRLTRDRLIVGVSGDISAAQLRPILDTLFADLPATAPGRGALPQATVSTVGKTSRIFRNLTQSTIMIGGPGIARNDPDWFPAVVADYVLGSGSFASRLMEEVREKRGLAYSVGSTLAPLDAGPIVLISAGTRADQAEQSLKVIREEVAKMRDPAAGPTAKEIEDAKLYLTGAFPLRFTTTGAVADILVQIQQDKLGIDYLDKRNKLIDAVTRDDVRRVSQRLYNPDTMTVVTVGPDVPPKPAPK